MARTVSGSGSRRFVRSDCRHHVESASLPMVGALVCSPRVVGCPCRSRHWNCFDAIPCHRTGSRRFFRVVPRSRCGYAGGTAAYRADTHHDWQGSCSCGACHDLGAARGGTPRRLCWQRHAAPRANSSHGRFGFRARRIGFGNCRGACRRPGNGSGLAYRCRTSVGDFGRYCCRVPAEDNNLRNPVHRIGPDRFRAICSNGVARVSTIVAGTCLPYGRRHRPFELSEWFDRTERGESPRQTRRSCDPKRRITVIGRPSPGFNRQPLNRFGIFVVRSIYRVRRRIRPFFGRANRQTLKRNASHPMPSTKRPRRRHFLLVSTDLENAALGLRDTIRTEARPWHATPLSAPAVNRLVDAMSPK